MFKFLGVFSSRRLAEEAIRRLVLLPGFRDYPECFNIYEFDIDEDSWGEGFVTMRYGY